MKRHRSTLALAALAVRTALAILIILVTNFLGLVITFSDTTSPNLVHWTAYIAASRAARKHSSEA